MKIIEFTNIYNIFQTGPRDHWRINAFRGHLRNNMLNNDLGSRCYATMASGPCRTHFYTCYCNTILFLCNNVLQQWHFYCGFIIPSRKSRNTDMDGHIRCSSLTQQLSLLPTLHHLCSLQHTGCRYWHIIYDAWGLNYMFKHVCKHAYINNNLHMFSFPSTLPYLSFLVFIFLFVSSLITVLITLFLFLYCQRKPPAPCHVIPKF